MYCQLLVFGFHLSGDGLSFPNPGLEDLDFQGLLLNGVIQLNGLFPENSDLLLQIPDAIIRGEQPFLLLRFTLYVFQLAFYFMDVRPVGVQELGLMLLHHVLHFAIHVVHCFLELSVDRPDALVQGHGGPRGLLLGLRGLGGHNKIN